ncbi:hypothetical protein [Candidatus Pseudothioglobus sp. Uisw_086]|uniref:hypothetical protein n=1 Tax=Candidatus Pseudothioglobus sp. Uisw_086 TaxID=3230998 RepID=UPI003A882AC0
MKKYNRKILLYIVYGDDPGYYYGAKFSYLTFMHWVKYENQVEVVVLTEKPDEFSEYPIKVISMSVLQKNDWSLNGKYHFRIKNRGLAYVMDKLKLESQDKILFFDTDTYFHKNPIPLFDLIKPNQALFYLNEGQIYKRKRFSIYIKYLEGKLIKVGNQNYKLSKKSMMWGSLMIGIMPNMRPSLDWADKLLIKLIDIVPAHTIEPFALSEALLKKYKIIEGKNYVSLYSTSRKKTHAVEILKRFFEQYQNFSIDEKIKLSQKVTLKRSFLKVLKQRIFQLLNYDK